MSTSKKKPSKILGLITEREAASLLLACANVKIQSIQQDAFLGRGIDKAKNKEAAAWLVAHYPDAFGMFDTTEHQETLVQIRDHLRKVWDEPDARRRDWYLFRLRETYQLAIAFASEEAKDFLNKLPQLTLNLLSGYLKGDPYDARYKLSDEAWDYHRRIYEAYEPPPPSAFEAALYFLQDRLRGLTKHCGSSDCPAPYFLATKRWQKYCSEKCSAPAMRDSKRQWWRVNRAKDPSLTEG